MNASRKPGEWQTYDIVFTAPRFDGEQAGPAGLLHRLLERRAGAEPHGRRWARRGTAQWPDYDSFETTGPMVLQYHNSAVRFRNIWIRPLKLDE